MTHASAAFAFWKQKNLHMTALFAVVHVVL